MTASVSFMDVAESPEFENAWKFVSETSTNYRDFLSLPMPQGCTHEQIWSVFSKQRRISGTIIPVNVWVNVDTNVGWMCLSGRSESKLVQLRKLASSSSRYNTYIRRNGIDDYYLHSFIFCEIRTLAGKDGMTFQSSILRDAWFHTLEPTNPLEQLAVNIESILHRADHYAHRRFSRGLIEDIYDDLCQNVPDSFNPIYSPRYDLAFYRDAIDTDPDYVDETLDQILAIFRNDTVFHDDFLRMLELTNFLWDIPLLPRFNHLVEYLVRKIYFTKVDNPILAFVPFAFATDHAEVSYVEEQYDAYNAMESAIGTKEGLDSTIVFESAIDIYHDYLREISTLIDKLENEEAAVVESIRKIPYLNHRQQEFLASATRNEHALHKILPYQRHFGVAYATARADLFDLVDRGLMSMRKVGKAFVFQVVPYCEWNI